LIFHYSNLISEFAAFFADLVDERVEAMDEVVGFVSQGDLSKFVRLPGFERKEDGFEFMLNADPVQLF
jgi:hypothetical protein